MFKVNKKDTRTTPGVVLVSLLLTLNIFTPCSSVSIVNFKQVKAGWVLCAERNIPFFSHSEIIDSSKHLNSFMTEAVII